MVDISPEPTYSHAQELSYKPLKQANNLHTNELIKAMPLVKLIPVTEETTFQFIFLQPQNAMQR